MKNWTTRRTHTTSITSYTSTETYKKKSRAIQGKTGLYRGLTYSKGTEGYKDGRPQEHQREAERIHVRYESRGRYS